MTLKNAPADSGKPNMNVLQPKRALLLLACTLFAVALVSEDSVSAESSFQWKAEDGKSLTLSCGDRVLWRFCYDAEQAKPYFHPVALPDGRVLTWNSPPDHPWHHALWFSWKFINGVNYWEPDASGHPPGKTRWQNVSISTRDNGSAQIAMDLTYGPSDAIVLMTERRVVEVSAPASDGTYAFDWTCQFTAGTEKVELNRTPLPDEPDGMVFGGYAGLSVRFAKELVEREAVTPQGPVEFVDSRFRGKSPAMDYNGLIAGKACGIAILDDPRNLNSPTPWYAIRSEPMSYYSPAVICYGPHTMEPGESFTLRYRVVVHDGRWTPQRLATETKRFLSGEQAGLPKVLDEHNYAGRKQQLEAVIADVTARIPLAENALRQYDAQFRKAADAHPGRKAYLEAMAETESLRAALAAAEKQVAEKRQEFARVQQETRLALNDLEMQRRRAQDELAISYDQRLLDAEYEEASLAEIRDIRREYTRMQNATNVRYDTLQISLKQKRSSAEQRARDAIGPLESEVNRIKTEQLGPAMAKAAPYQAFLDQEQQKREMIAGQLGSLQRALEGAKTRLKNLPKPRPAEDIAQGRLKMAKALLNQNAKAGRKRLEEVVAKYGGTGAAEEAAQILKDLDDK